MKKFYAILECHKSGGSVDKLTYFSKTKHGFKVYSDPTSMMIGMDKRDHAFTKGDITNLKIWIGQHPTETKGFKVSDLDVISIEDFDKKIGK